MKISKLCFGCEALGGNDWGNVDLKEIEKSIQKGLMKSNPIVDFEVGEMSDGNYDKIETKFENDQKNEKIDQILKKMRELL